jgi:hypothetical protein
VDFHSKRTLRRGEQQSDMTRPRADAPYLLSEA